MVKGAVKKHLDQRISVGVHLNREGEQDSYFHILKFYLYFTRSCIYYYNKMDVWEVLCML